MRKNSRILTLLLVVVLGVCAVTTGCSKKAPTFEDYVKDHPELEQKINGLISNSGLDGTAEVKDNSIILTVDITSALGAGITLDDSTRELLWSTFDEALAPNREDMKSTIANLEKEAGVTGLTISFVIVYSGETVYEITYTS